MSESIMRWMRQSDMPEIVKIENQCFPHPWDRDDFDVCLKKKDHIGVVLTIDKTIVGYMIFNFNKSSYNILSIAVDPNHYKNGFGRRMIEYLKTKIRSSAEGPKDKIHLIVSDQNLNCHNFLKALQFKAIRIHKRYFGPEHDAYEFFLDMNENKVEVKKVKNRKPRKIKDGDRLE